MLSQCLGVRSQCPAMLSQCLGVDSQCPAVLSQHPSVRRQCLGVPIHRFLDVQHGIGDRGEVVLDARDAARQLQAGHAGQSIAFPATPGDTVLATVSHHCQPQPAGDFSTAEDGHREPCSPRPLSGGRATTGVSPFVLLPVVLPPVVAGRVVLRMGRMGGQRGGTKRDDMLRMRV
jgi:hypothetical protein